MTSLGKAQHILNAKENELALVQADFEKAISEKQVYKVKILTVFFSEFRTHDLL